MRQDNYMKKIEPRSHINAKVSIPGSKSISHRALIAAALAKGESRLEAFLDCEDTQYTLKTLRELGVEISAKGESVSVLGTGGEFSPIHRKKEVFLGNSGTSYRLLLSVAALGRGDYLFTGSPRMNSRPIGDLVMALNNLGVKASCVEKEGFPPVYIEARGIRGGRVKIPGTVSSQYLSSILLAGPYAEESVEIEVMGKLVSRPYVDLTIDVMSAFGIDVKHDEYHYFRLPEGEKYQSRGFTIEGDVSAASYFWAAAAVTGGTVITDNIHPYSTRQGDIAFLDILEDMGCKIQRGDNGVTVRGGGLSGVEADMGAMPDMVPTLAAVALFAEGKTIIKNVPHLHYKESDRISDTALELKKLGGKIEELEDGLMIHGGGKLTGAEVDPHKDHRLAMCFAVAGLKIPGIRIKEERCVDKSFPTFWELWAKL